MFKRKPKLPLDESIRKTKGPVWFTISLIANLILLIWLTVDLSAGAVIHQSNTDPEFCAKCHLMEANVTSYLTSNHLDHVHAEAGVGCKDCHSDYDLWEEIRSGVRYLSKNYQVNEDGSLTERDYTDEMCTQCHGGMLDVAVQTDYLYFNPHNSGMGEFSCDTCHPSHDAQIDYCNDCHQAPGQRMIEDNSWRNEWIGVMDVDLD
ncbi:MAG: cytochrome c3 family protein [Anaerolineales bacterium]|nr:cytochrome c3 family protein [Anaerolineales bacterium]